VSAAAAQARTAPAALEAAPAFLLVCMALILGGSSAGAASTLYVRLAAIPVLIVALWRLSGARPAIEARWPAIIFAVALLAAAVQLIPLPPSAWTALPGRAIVVQGYQAAGMPLPWLPISLAPDATFDGLLGFLPAAAMFLSVLTLDGRGRRALLAAVLAVAFLAVIAGMLQMATGPAGPFRPYAITNRDSAVGFFANRNHQAAFLLCAIPTAAYWAVRPAGKAWDRSLFIAGLAIAVFMVLVVSLSLTRSRAGVLLLAPALIGSAFVAARRRNGGLSWAPPAILASAGVVAIGLVILFSFNVLASRFHADLNEDMRAQVTPLISRASEAYAPVGTGLGSFQAVYEVMERPESMTSRYINHAHDDYLETWLELGAAGAAVIVAFVAWWAVTTIRILRRRAGEASLAMAGAVMVGVLLAHSWVDYPLRTPALATLFALGCALMIPAPGAATEPTGPRRRTSRRELAPA